MPLSPKNRPGWIWVLLAYVAAGIVSVLVTQSAPDSWHPLLVILAADVAATVAVFLFCLGFNNSSIYDPYWSVAPIAIAGYLIAQAEVNACLIRQLMVFGVICTWGGRLTFNWWRQWTGMAHEDWRYLQLKQQTGKAYWLVSFAGIHLFPTMLVYLACLSLFPALDSQNSPFNFLDVVGFVICGIAIWTEASADKQLYRFVNSKPATGTILKSGLWRYCRHPNYLGEIMFWWGIFFFALASGWQYWWCIAGPLSINALFVFISIPMHEKRSLARRPNYAEHMQRVPRLLPRLKDLIVRHKG
jgi:steroid 5-alpha reductase family enzyme